MGRFILRVAVVASMLVLEACRAAPLLNPSRVAFQPRRIDRVERAIFQAFANRRWLPSKRAPGEIVGTLNIRSHQAVVRVRYGENWYDLDYVSSKNLDYERDSKGRETIHSNFNGWIGFLTTDLDTILAQQTLELGAPPQSPPVLVPPR